jgi:hypothetical protein
MVLRLPYPALDKPCTLQLAMQTGETGRHPLESDDSLSILRSNLALKDRKVTYPCLSANACQEH